MSRAFAGQENIANAATMERRFVTEFLRAHSPLQSALITVAAKRRAPFANAML